MLIIDHTAVHLRSLIPFPFSLAAPAFGRVGLIQVKLVLAMDQVICSRVARLSFPWDGSHAA